MTRPDYCPDTGEPCQSLCIDRCGSAPNAWKEAVLDRLAINCMDAPKSESPESILRRVIDIEVSIALNPQVSERAQQLIDLGSNVIALGQKRHDLQALVDDIKAAVFARTGAISVTEAIGALEIAKMEIFKEQK